MDDKKETREKIIAGIVIFFIIAAIALGITGILMLVKWKNLLGEDECSKFAGMEGKMPPCLTQDDLDKRRDAFIGCSAASLVICVGLYIYGKYS